MPYIGEQRDRSPLNVMLDQHCHCLDGGFFAALALWRIGFKPLLIDLVPDPGMDDDHVLAIFRSRGHWGALAKSNYSGLRFREPVYRTLRELVMSYFEHYYNLGGEKTLPQSLQCIRPGGTLSIIGVLSGAAPAAPLGRIVTRQVRLQGITVGSRDSFETMLRAVELHKVQPVVDRIFPFEGLKDALAYMKSGSHFGKICIRH